MRVLVPTLLLLLVYYSTIKQLEIDHRPTVIENLFLSLTLFIQRQSIFFFIAYMGGLCP